MENITT